MFSRIRTLLLAGTLAAGAHAAPLPFDLAGPVLDARVTRGGATLPISEVPNLAAGDRLWLKVDLPANQSSRYLLVAAFLSGSTNPPPESWFHPCKTWTGECAHDGLSVTVPEGAGQVLLFLAPHTGGDFRTLVGAVRGRPGAFVRTSQDLNQAALDRSRLERYLQSIRSLNDGDPAQLKTAAPLLARSLAIKVDEKCLDRIPELQAPCLMQGQEALILNDGHSTSIVEALTSGPGSDLAMEASYTPQLSYGYYSPYIASVLDIGRIFDSFRTAQYQYIPALGSQHGERISLTLNSAPSFHNPMSVLVAALPAVETAQLPPLHAVDPKAIYCASRARLVLPVEGAPLVFATVYAHDMSLRLTAADGRSIALPAAADAMQGGFVVDTAGLRAADLGDSVRASLQGRWGFEPYAGPEFRLMNSRALTWELTPADAATLIVGRQDTVHFRADSVSCVDGIMLKDPAGKELQTDWKSVKPNEVEVTLPLQEAEPGAMTLMVRQSGVAEPQAIPIQAFSDAGRFEGFRIHAGDSFGVLRGSRLASVSKLSIGDVSFVPAESMRHGVDELPMVAQDGQALATLNSNHGAARIMLKDGREFTVAAAVDPSRPRVTLIGKSVQPSPSSIGSHIRLADAGELPQDGTLIFSVRAAVPAVFGRDESLEVAPGDESNIAVLSLANGGLLLENSQVAVATLIPAKAFGASAFGPLRFRVNAGGVTGDWQPLGSLVRLPMLKDLKCPAAAEVACKLSGSDLFLIDSVAGDAQFTQAVQVPDGFLADALPVPHPPSGALFVKLRDDPATVHAATLVAEQLPASPEDLARSAARTGSSDAAPIPPNLEPAPSAVQSVR